jgi:Sulfotransferase domain
MRSVSEQIGVLMSGGLTPAAPPDESRPPHLRGAALMNFYAREAISSMLLAARLPAGRLGMLPSFLIVGGQRCGTSSLKRALSQHPGVFAPVLYKEVHYFDLAYHRGLGWYRSRFPLQTREWLTGTAGVAFESTPYYMFHPLAPERIARDLPGVKLLVLVRDPTERAYSAHAHEVFLRYETEPFERALELEATRLEGEAERIVAEPGYASFSHQHHAYRTRGQYTEQLERLEKIFGQERIHVVDSEAFFRTPEPVYDAVLEFLGLPHRGYPPFKAHNARARSSPMPGSVRAALEEHYRPYDERLAKWLGRDPSWRLRPEELQPRPA